MQSAPTSGIQHTAVTGRTLIALLPPPSPLMDGVPLLPEEYPLPFSSVSFYNILKHTGWACLTFAAYHGDKYYLIGLELCLLILVAVTLTAHNRLELKVGEAIDHLSQHLAAAANSSGANEKRAGEEVSGSGGRRIRESLNEATPAQRRPVDGELAQKHRLEEAQREYFTSMELRMIAGRQPTEQLLDFCLDIFGVLWIGGLSFPCFSYGIPNVGKPWLSSTLIGNFANDIAALVVGRTLKLLRGRYEKVYDMGNSGAKNGKRPIKEANMVVRLILQGPHPLYRAISPNKSVEGAVMGVVANACTFTGLMWGWYRWFSPPPAPDVLLPEMQSIGIWFFAGFAMGILGVIGDLLQSLLKRAARVKDAGFIIPGHGGILDRVDGLLIVFPFMYCFLCALMQYSASQYQKQQQWSQ